MTDELKAEREAYSKVIKSLAAIVMCQQDAAMAAQEGGK